MDTIPEQLEALREDAREYLTITDWIRALRRKPTKSGQSQLKLARRAVIEQGFTGIPEFWRTAQIQTEEEWYEENAGIGEEL